MGPILRAGDKIDPTANISQFTVRLRESHLATFVLQILLSLLFDTLACMVPCAHRPVRVVSARNLCPLKVLPYLFSGPSCHFLSVCLSEVKKQGTKASTDKKQVSILFFVKT